jgi:transposase
MSPYGSPKTLERRRRRAVWLLADGLRVREVARRMHASVASGYRWQHAWADGGEAALAPQPGSGRPRQLTDQQGAPWAPL